jgi:hypothetical protein
MRSLLSIIALTTAIVAPATFAADQAPPPPREPPGQYDKGSPSKDQMDHSKMAAADFASLVKNKDGKITRDEVPADSPLARHFAMLDTEKDGSLSKAEFDKLHSMRE